MIERLREEAHVWLAEIGQVESEPSLDLLSAAEQQRAGNISHVGARRQFIAGRALARRALSQYTPVQPPEWRFATSDFGRPEIAAPTQAPPLRFNLSHTADLAACLVTSRIDCGVDIETLDRDVDVERIAEHSFGDDEQARIEQLSSPEREDHFFDLWTLKESYLKARGSGIRLRLDSVRFQITEGGRILAGFRDRAERSDHWQFSLFDLAPRHRLAVALSRAGRDDYRVVGWRLDDRGQARRQTLQLLGATRS